MDTAVHELLVRGVSRATLATYASGKKRYLSFCEQFGLSPLPVSETILCRFVAFLSAIPINYQSIRSYLSAVRHLQITSGLPDPALSPFARLDYVLKGARRQGLTAPRPKRMPITAQVLQQIHQAWAQLPPTFDRVMLWAAFCLGFFGFMRAGEFTCPSLQAFTPNMLAVRDIQVDSHSAPSHLSVLLRESKTDQFGAGMTIHLGATGDKLCPVVAMLGYLAIRPPSPGPLFIFKDGTSLSRQRLVQMLRQALQLAGISDTGFSGHSFRIGAATAAAQAGLNDSLIQTLGRWKSAAFNVYIRTPWQQIAAVSQSLASQAKGV